MPIIHTCDRCGRPVDPNDVRPLRIDFYTNDREAYNKTRHDMPDANYDILACLDCRMEVYKLANNNPKAAEVKNYKVTVT